MSWRRLISHAPRRRNNNKEKGHLEKSVSAGRPAQHPTKRKIIRADNYLIPIASRELQGLVIIHILESLRPMERTNSNFPARGANENIKRRGSKSLWAEKQANIRKGAIRGQPCATVGISSRLGSGRVRERTHSACQLQSNIVLDYREII